MQGRGICVISIEVFGIVSIIMISGKAEDVKEDTYSSY